MNCKAFHFSRHAFERMFQRGIDPDAVAKIITNGEIIADYPDDQPFLSYFWGSTEASPCI